MAKSIRSKIKRKHRAEFRRTIGEKAYQDGMAKIQAKLTQVIDKGSSETIPSLTKISNLFQNVVGSNNDNDYNSMILDSSAALQQEDSSNEDNSIMAVDAMETTTIAASAAVTTTTEPTNTSNTTTTSPSLLLLKGENKVPVKKIQRKRKGKMGRGKKNIATIESSSKERPKPRFFCQFT